MKTDSLMFGSSSTKMVAMSINKVLMMIIMETINFKTKEMEKEKQKEKTRRKIKIKLTSIQTTIPLIKIVMTLIITLAKTSTSQIIRIMFLLFLLNLPNSIKKLTQSNMISTILT